MSNDNKTDLSDLKARLGLKKPTAKSSGGASSSAPSTPSTSSGPQRNIPRPDKSPVGSGGFEALKKSTESGGQATLDKAVGPSAAAGRPSAGAAPRAASPAAPAPKPAPRPGPPPGAMGPPPTTRKREDQAATGPSELEKAAMAKVDFKDLGIDEDVGLGLSAPIIALLVLLLVGGLFFGFMFSQSLQVRDLENRRISDAQRMQTYLEPRLEALTEALDIIEGLTPGEVDHEAAQRLAALDFTIGPSVLPNNRILLGREVVGPVNQMAAQTALLREKILEHNALTNQIDRQELTRIRENQQNQLSDAGRLGIVFDVAQIAAFNRDPEAYIPPTARVIAVTGPEQDEEGMIEIKALYREGETRRVSPLVVMYLEEGDLTLSDGENAAFRYNRRVQSLRDMVEPLRRRVEPLQVAVANTANADPPALFALTGSSREYEEGEDSALDAAIEE